MKKLKEKTEKVRRWYTRNVQPALTRAYWKLHLYGRHTLGFLGRCLQRLNRRPHSWVWARVLMVAGFFVGMFALFLSLSQGHTQAQTPSAPVIRAETMKTALPPMAAGVPETPPQPKLQGTVTDMPRPPALPVTASAYTALPPSRTIIQVKPEAGLPEPLKLERRKAEKPEAAAGSRYMRLQVTGEKVEFYPSRRNREQMRQARQQQEETREVSPRRKVRPNRRLVREETPRLSALERFFAARENHN